jgi:cytoskeletal protein RodZ
MKSMIGERLEEARKRKGVSIREAAEATKIRGDFLMEMEDNSFDIPLPQIYIRGFLKNYARFLKLDPNKILTDFDAQMLSRRNQSAAASRSRAESLGHVEIPERRGAGEGEEVVITEAPEDEGPEPELRFNLDRGAEGRSSQPPPAPTRQDQEVWNENKTLYMKIGIVFAAIIAVAIILIVMIQLLTGKPESPDINPELAATPAARPVQSVPATPASQSRTDTIVISASDNVTLIVEQTLDRKRLYSGSLNAGESLSLDKEGPVSIRFTNGSAVLIEKDGRQFKPGSGGVGRTVVE